jgi:hypothetical protein
MIAIRIAIPGQTHVVTLVAENHQDATQVIKALAVSNSHWTMSAGTL